MQQSEKVYLLCLNPHCLNDRQRCLTAASLHTHPRECLDFFYPADQVEHKHWTKLDKYPLDSLGIAASKKITAEGQKSYIAAAIDNMRQKFEACIRELQEKIEQLHPQKEFARTYANVYNLQKVAECLKLRKNPAYISSLISENFSAHHYHVLLRANESLDELRNTVDALGSNLSQHFSALLKQKTQASSLQLAKKVHHKKLNYGVCKSRFIASSKIEINKAVIVFPKLNNIASFLPWIYTDRPFSEGIHEFKISSQRYPIVQNSGFTVLQEHDIDTYPYSHFKSLFNREGKGFTLVQGEEIDQFVAQTTVVVLRIELGASSRAVLFDSQMRCRYECLLKEKTSYRMGVYGCGWAMEVVELS